jgi:hypothetical protein
MNNIKIKPWVGNNYSSPKYNSHSILILGESHYGENPKVSSDCTINLVQGYINRALDRSTFWTHVAQFVSGIHHTSKEFDRNEIWNDFGFYNYIQSIVGNEPRVETELKQYRESEDAFFQVIEENKPEIVIALGSRLFSRMYPLYKKKISINGKTKGRLYEINDDEFICASVRHPSAGFSYKKYHPMIKECEEWINKT